MTDSDIGREIEAYCSKCKDDTLHVITAKQGEKISKVMCQVCLSYHQYRASKKEKQKSSASSKRLKVGKKRSRHLPSEDWFTLISKVDLADAVDYQISGDYTTSSVLRHHVFGIGIIKEVLSPTKIKVIFQEGTKILAQNHEFLE